MVAVHQKGPCKVLDLTWATPQQRICSGSQAGQHAPLEARLLRRQGAEQVMDAVQQCPASVTSIDGDVLVLCCSTACASSCCCKAFRKSALTSRAIKEEEQSLGGRLQCGHQMGVLQSSCAASLQALCCTSSSWLGAARRTSFSALGRRICCHAGGCRSMKGLG
jgi:hypothetical protein